MQHTVILVLATMLALVAVVFVFMLWRAYGRSVRRRRLHAADASGWAHASSWPGDRAAAQRANASAPPAPSSDNDDVPGHALRATLYGAGTATAAILHH